MRVWASLATAAILALPGRPAWAEDTQGGADAARAVYVACDEGWRTGNVQAILDTYAPDFGSRTGDGSTCHLQPGAKRASETQNRQGADKA